MKRTPIVEGREATKLLKPYGKPEAVLDLHGMNRLDAHDAFHAFIEEMAAEGVRHVLVVTGKGSGIIRDSVRQWVEDASRTIIAAARARPEKGGDGALHVVLRKAR